MSKCIFISHLDHLLRPLALATTVPQPSTMALSTCTDHQLTEQHLVDADAAYRVTPEGNVVYLPPSQVDRELEELAQKSSAQTMLTTEQTKGATDVFEPPVVQPATRYDARERQTNTAVAHGSLSLYAYLFRPAGMLFLAIWLFSTALASLSEKLPSMLLSLQDWFSFC